MRLVGSRFKVLLLAVCALALLPASAHAVTIDGDQLDIHLDGDGNVQVLALGQSSFSFYPPGTEAGDAGFFIRSAGTTYGPPLAAGPKDVNFTPVSQDGVTGSGTKQQVTTYKAGTVAEVTQTTTYVNGTRSFKQRFDVKNISGGSLSYQAFAAADLYLEGSDNGIGFFAPGPPRVVGGLSEATGRAGGLSEVSGYPWSAYQEASYDDIWDNVFSGGLENSIVAGLIDNGIGVQWNEAGLGAGSTASYEVEWLFGLAGLTATPPSALLGTGSFHQVTLTATDANGDLIDNGTIRYDISGTNPGSGTVTTGGNGKAQVGWVGNNAGTDTLTAYLDVDGNNSQDASEPQTSVNAVFVSPAEGPSTSEPPVLGAPPLVLQGRPILQNGTTTLVVVVPSAGRLHVEQAAGGKAGASASARKNAKSKKGKKRRKSLIKPITLKPKKAGPVRVKIKPTKLGKKALAKRGKFTVKVKISFTPKGSKKTESLTRKVTIKKKKKSKQK